MNFCKYSGLVNMTVWWAQYIRVREPESTMGSAECAAVPCREPLACYVKHSEQLPRVRCAAMCTRVEGQCARARTAECRVAPFRGCGPKKQSISLLPTARRSFSFIDSCPPILVPKPSPEFTNVTIVESSIPSAAKYDRSKKVV